MHRPSSKSGHRALAPSLASHDLARESGAAPSQVPAPQPEEDDISHERLDPPPSLFRDVLTSPLGVVLARPWLDRIAPWFLRRYLFPLSRAWAAAQVSGEDPETFRDEIPMPNWAFDRKQVVRALRKAARARTLSEAADRLWEQHFFGPLDEGAAKRIAVESARHRAVNAHFAARRYFRFALPAKLPRVKYDVPSPDDVDAIYGNIFLERARFFEPARPSPDIALSRSVPTAEGYDHWVRFASPSDRLADTVYARVHVPRGVTDPPTIVFGHGVAVEFDQWLGVLDEANALVARGIRVIRPEAPWHGRRTPQGRYGGEPLMSTSPAGTLDLFTGAVREWAVLADWARATSRGPLAFGGNSLGAMTAQLAADCARDWPGHLMPDALLLISHCGSMADTALHGDIMRTWGRPEIIQASGWSTSRVEAYMSVLDPRSPLPVPGERIVTVLGALDDVTPFRTAEALLERWGVPSQNRYIWHGGHFSVPAMLARRPGVADHFVNILNELS